MRQDTYRAGIRVFMRFLSGMAGLALTGSGFAQGLVWTQRLSGTISQLSGIAFNGVSFISTGESSAYLGSSDGLAWTVRTGPSSTGGPIQFTGGVWIAVDSGSVGRIYRSTDGINWTLSANAGRVLRDVCAGNGVIVISASAGALYRSVDNGISWQFAVSPTGFDVNFVAYGNGMFLALDSGGNTLRSADGLYWTLATRIPAVPNGSYTGLTFGQGQFITSRTGTPSSVFETAFLRSADAGDTWTVTTSSAQIARTVRIRFANGRFVALSNGTAVYSSADGGLTWQTSIIPAVGLTFRDVAYGNGRWVTAGSNGVIFTAEDSGTPIAPPSVTMTPAVLLDWQTNSGTTYEVQSSPDMQTWQRENAPFLGDGNQGTYFGSRTGARRFFRVIAR